MSKATHDGDCQICGRRQRLPNGLLAAHGYVVEWSCFIGTCPGSHATPFQVSTHLIDAAIAGQETVIDSLKAEAAALRNPQHPDNVAGRAWHRGYDGNRKTGYFWERGTLRRGGKSYNDYQSHYFHCVFAPDVVRVKKGFNIREDGSVEIQYSSGTVQEEALKLNESYAKTLDQRIGEIRKWIAWQRTRLVGWKPEPLIPRAK